MKLQYSKVNRPYFWLSKMGWVNLPSSSTTSFSWLLTFQMKMAVRMNMITLKVL